MTKYLFGPLCSTVADPDQITLGGAQNTKLL